MGRRSVLLIAAVGFLAATGLTAGEGPAAAHLTPDCRLSVDLSADPATQSMMQDANITATEAAKRMSWQYQADPIRAALATDLPTVYSALWFDVQNGDRMQVNVKSVNSEGAIVSVSSDVVHAVTSAAAMCGVIDAVDVRAVGYSLADHDKVQAWLKKTLRGGSAVEQFTIVGWGDLTESGQINVMAGDPTTRSPALVSALVSGKKLFGDLLVVTDEKVPVIQAFLNRVAPHK